MTLFDPTGGPVWPRFTVDVAVFEVKLDVTVAFFRCYTPPHFSMFPYLILLPSIKAAYKMLMKLTAGKEQGLTIFHWKATLGDTDPLILTVPGYIIWCRQTVSVVTPFSTCLYDKNHFLRIYTYKLVFKKLVSSPWNKFVLLLWYTFVFWSFF